MISIPFFTITLATVMLFAASLANAANLKPVAAAGPDLTAGLAVKITLDGRHSHDPDGSIRQYLWRQIRGPKVPLLDATKATVSFTTPSKLNGKTATLVFKLTVTDHQGATDHDHLTVYVTKNPVCHSPQVLLDGLCLKPPSFNDTGITRCSDTAVYGVDCPLALLPGQDGDFGRDVSHSDASDGKAGFSFTKIGAHGEELPGDAPEWTCIKDNVTQLIWEVKTDDGGLRDKDLLYSYYSQEFNPVDQFGADTDAEGLIQAVNAEKLCGKTDWRLPSLEELRGLVDYGIALPGPTIDTTFFPNTRSGAYWSGSGDGKKLHEAWAVFFSDGEVYNPDRGNRYAVRLVRGERPLSHFVISSDGEEVTDRATGLIWRRCMEGMNWDGATCTGTPKYFMWYEALQYVASERVGWRLPNVKEMASLVDTSNDGPLAMNTTIFPNTTNDQFWTSSPFVLDVFYGWVVHSFYGHSYFTYLEDSGAIRLVRGGA
jgi:hypothetical protein